MNNDKYNVSLLLSLLRPHPTSADLLNALDVSDTSPLHYCLKLGHNDIAALILNHPQSKVGTIEQGGSGFFQGVAEISSGGGTNLPGSGDKIARFFSAFFTFLHNITNLRPIFDILDTCYKEIGI